MNDTIASTRFARRLSTCQPIKYLTSTDITLSPEFSIYQMITSTTGGTFSFTFTLDSNAGTFASSNISYTFELQLNINSAATTLTFPSNVSWQDNELPDLTKIGRYFLVFRTTDGGVTWFGNSQGYWPNSGNSRFEDENDIWGDN